MSSLESLLEQGGRQAENLLRDEGLLASLQRHSKGAFPSARLASLVESLKKSFAGAYALENNFYGLVESQDKGLEKSTVIAYEMSKSIVTALQPFAQVRLTNEEKDTEKQGRGIAESVLRSFINEFKETDYEGLFNGDGSIINYATEFFHAVKNKAGKNLSSYLLKDNLFKDKTEQAVGYGKVGEQKGDWDAYKPKIGFTDVMGLDEFKERLSLQVFGYAREQERWRTLVEQEEKTNVRLNIAMDGPPGVGKSHLSKAIAGELDAPFFLVKGSDFIKKYLGEGKDRLESLYKQASGYGIGVICIEEADILGLDRDGDEAKHKRDIINAWLTILEDGVDKGKVITVINTNKLAQFDQAVLDRFPAYNRFTFGAVSDQMKERIFRYNIGVYRHEDIGSSDVQAAIASLNGNSLRGLGDIAYLSSCYALRNNHDIIKKNDIKQALDNYQRLKV